MNNPTSESLAAIIVSNRVLGLFSEESKFAMSELLRRREDDGDSFEFEKYIEDRIKSINDTLDSSRSNNGLVSLISAIGKMR